MAVVSVDDSFRPRTYPDSGFPRQPTVLARAMAATSHPLATRAAVGVLEAGGNAVDAALAAAAVLIVAEPCECGLGGDGFAQIWFNGRLHAINGSGRSPRHPRTAPAVYGPDSVTVPGVVAMWADLSSRWGRFGLDTCLKPAIVLAEDGLAITGRIAALWRQAAAEGRAPSKAPAVGERYRMPELGRSLRTIAEMGPAGLYQGALAASIAEASWLSGDDLAGHRSEWVEPLRISVDSVEVCELPPNSQGVAALEAIALTQGLFAADEAGRLSLAIDAMKVALADTARYVGDAPLPSGYLDDDRLTGLRELIRTGQKLPAANRLGNLGGTSYLCVVDEERNAVSLIQSLFHHFGSGVTAPGTGITLQNRAAGFDVSRDDGPNGFAAAKRPFHTLMPGMLLKDNRLLGPFGVMGGIMQAQGHLQVLTRLLDDQANPQSALDGARFRIDADGTILLEPGLWPQAEGLHRHGQVVRCAFDPGPFGVGQIILCYDDALVGGSDGRGDGMVSGL